MAHAAHACESSLDVHVQSRVQPRRTFCPGGLGEYRTILSLVTTCLRENFVDRREAQASATADTHVDVTAELSRVASARDGRPSAIGWG